MSDSPPGPLAAAGGAAFAELLLSSHLALTGRPLCPPRWASMHDAAHWLYTDAPFGLLAHGMGPDPAFIYANRTAQRCFQYSWEEFIGMPSRLSASPLHQEDRHAFVRSVHEHGFADGYSGLRRTKSGEEFWIKDVTMWDLLDPEGNRRGQAAVFRDWRGP
ncbi:MEKHLA domain-containing protein [Streptomyces sp. Z423-1]|uniref:MEKHLA domain-containing protein n=1 Tax=Streptomyces sp. Z423-1 TaxID=2730915 RepID=UPI001487969F|nr:MEKHLA domain-containing protein [Streptomyces sp. Z423-1]